MHYGEDVGDVVLNALQLSTTAEKCSKNIAICTETVQDMGPLMICLGCAITPT